MKNRINMDSASAIIARVTEVTILPKGEPLFCERATVIRIEDEAAGEFITMQQCTDTDEHRKVSIDPDEWSMIKSQIDTMIADIVLFERKSNGPTV